MASTASDQYATLIKLCILLNTISFISSFASCVTFGFIRTYYPKLADRVSFRLSFAALLCNIGYSGHHLLVFCWDATPGFLCVYAPWAIVFFALSSTFFIVCIALGLQPGTNCWYLTSDHKRKIIWEWVTLFSWIDTSILYCAIVIIMVIRKLKFAAKQMDAFDFSLTTRLSSNPPIIDKAMISSVVRKVVWYPVLPVAQIFGSFTETYYYVNNTTTYPLMLTSFSCMAIQGLLNALVFSQDVAVTRTFQAVKLQWWISNVNSYESHYPHRSNNKAIEDKFSTLGKFNDFVELKALNCNNADIIKISEPSFLEWLSYMLLIKLFSPPKSPSRLTPINTFVGNDDSNQDVNLDDQNDDQVILPKPAHLKDSNQYSSSSHCLNLSNSYEPLIGSSKSYQANQTNNTDVIDILNCAVEDEGRIDIMNIIGESTKRISEEFTRVLGSDVELFKETKKMLRKL
ncbi:24524_t:CDS:2 [Dentiscutata erythropus]|uniref:24524_t:CDS:1 n=1 Tax=Dentiscutata erythropus TaxID=1348616 RepID=A0A9N9JAW5_9GLOM|nr:24524_t:CDS:2 [Dentiscutata erythropus]